MNKPKAIGVHIYAGGFTQGIQNYFQVVGHLETSKFGVETARQNLKIDIKIDAELKPVFSDNNVELIYGNPPCVAFSQLGHRQYLEHATIADVRSLLRIGLHYKPLIWVWECVPQVWMHGRKLVEEVVAEWHKLGYATTVFLTDANLYGMPQRRNRFHLIAHKLELDFVHKEALELNTCGDALIQVTPEVDPKNLQVRRYLQWMEQYALAGYPLRRIWFHLHGIKTKPEGMRFCPPFCIQRLHGELPSCTLTGGPDFIHPYEWRVLSPGEMAHLSGYPSGWKWYGPMIERYKQVAKGVTPVIGNYLGKVFYQAIEYGKMVNPGPSNINVIDHRAITDTYWKQVKVRKELPQEWFGTIKETVCLS